MSWHRHPRVAARHHGSWSTKGRHSCSHKGGTDIDRPTVVSFMLDWQVDLWQANDVSYIANNFSNTLSAHESIMANLDASLLLSIDLEL